MYAKKIEVSHVYEHYRNFNLLLPTESQPSLIKTKSHNEECNSIITTSMRKYVTLKSKHIKRNSNLILVQSLNYGKQIYRKINK